MVALVWSLPDAAKIRDSAPEFSPLGLQGWSPQLLGGAPDPLRSKIEEPLAPADAMADTPAGTSETVAGLGTDDPQNGIEGTRKQVRQLIKQALENPTADDLRVRPKSSCPGQASEHQFDDGKVDEGSGGSGEVFEIAGEASVATDPGEGSLDDPALGLEDETLGAIGAFDYLDAPVAGTAGGLADARSLVAGIGEDGGDEGKASPHPFGQDERRAVAVLDACLMDDRGKQKALVIGEDMALDSLDLLARVEPDRIDRRPPFCADLALWLSRMAADGLASRPSCSRKAT